MQSLAARSKIALAFVWLAFLGACSPEKLMDMVVPEQDRAFSQAMVENLRAGNRAWLQAHLDPQLWAVSEGDIEPARRKYPHVHGTNRLTSYTRDNGVVGERQNRVRKTFEILTDGGSSWAVTRFRTESTGGPDLVVEWEVERLDSEPAFLRIERATRGWRPATLVALGIGLGASIAIGVTALLFLWRRRRKKSSG
jgi:hypothetical protein